MAVQIYYQSIHEIVINEQLLSMLTPRRRQQLFSLRFEADKKRCAAAGLLLWEHLYHRHPEHFTVSYNAAGKPSISYRSALNSEISPLDASGFGISDSPLTVPFFNLSHSGDFVMLAISDTPVGCDIERLHKAILSHHVFHKNELALLSSLPEGDARNREFLRLWTAKEAFLKAIGTGIDADATTYDLSQSNSICLSDGSVWAIEHHTLPDSYKNSCEASHNSSDRDSDNHSSKPLSEHPSEYLFEYLSCICYKCLQ